jgi:hypothetical protein
MYISTFYMLTHSFMRNRYFCELFKKYIKCVMKRLI